MTVSAPNRSAFPGISSGVAAGLGPLRRGKVRDVIDLGDRLALVATDRLSAFDRVLGLVPHRGQILNQLSAWWFELLGDIVPSHIVAVPDPNVSIVSKCEPLPVEVVVRSRLTGTTSTSLWTMYESGARRMYGIDFGDGMVKNDPLPRPVITPTTKAHSGHDQPLSEAAVVSEGWVDGERWEEVRSVALALFERGRRTAEEAGLVLVDTKYEFGIGSGGRLTLIDEVHTPDSSRLWRLATLESRRDAGLEPENLDKEIVRLAYAAGGYRGEGAPGPLSPALAAETAAAYRQAFEALTGAPLRPARYPAEPRIAAALRAAAHTRRAVEGAR
ncbi:MAG: phosphoribosylaminoimidazolesuccinocarboxamide synthase [bacterium]|nr:phosphoribosylaminoimidazolesuccinocarboxamide synthase [bacterium]